MIYHDLKIILFKKIFVNFSFKFITYKLIYLILKNYK